MQLAKWTREQARSMSSMGERGTRCYGARGWALDEMSRVTTHPENSAEGKTEINNPPGGGEFGLSSFLFSQPGPVPKPLNLLKILALHPRKEPPGGPQQAKS